MKNMRTLALILGLLLAVAGEKAVTQASEKPFTAQELYEDCSAGAESIFNTVCNYYITGFVEGLRIGALPTAPLSTLTTIALREGLKKQDQEWLVKIPGLACIPSGVTSQQVELVFEKYAMEHPQKLHDPAPLVLWNALKGAFPCE